MKRKDISNECSGYTASGETITMEYNQSEIAAIIHGFFSHFQFFVLQLWMIYRIAIVLAIASAAECHNKKIAGSNRKKFLN